MKVSKKTRRRLKVWAAEHDYSYDEAIDELLDRAEDNDE